MADYKENDGYPYINLFDFNDELLDFILVDGKLRDKCSLKGMQLLKEGGFLIIDNINRYVPNKSQSPDSLGYLDKCATTDWEEFYNLTIGWQKIWTSDGITDTAIYLKP